MAKMVAGHKKNLCVRLIHIWGSVDIPQTKETYENNDNSEIRGKGILLWIEKKSAEEIFIMQI